jgi:hypothetical protein
LLLLLLLLVVGAVAELSAECLLGLVGELVVELSS